MFIDIFSLSIVIIISLVHTFWLLYDYKIIIEKIKKNCEYYDILNKEGIDYLCYSCPQSKYSGKIGYSVVKGMGTIIHFPKESNN